MTLYPRRDVVHVAVSPAEGGCGASHTRPVTRGAPDLDWVLNCPPCERALVTNPQWSGTRSEIPETPDEIIEREGLEKRGVRDRETVIAAALAKLAGIADDQRSAQATVCKRGHPNLPSSRFCGECGMPLAEQPEEFSMAVKRATEVSALPDGFTRSGSVKSLQTSLEKVAAERPGSVTVLPPGGPDYAKMTLPQLRSLAANRGIDPKQAKKDLITALSA